jgi:hypothetical protein
VSSFKDKDSKTDTTESLLAPASQVPDPSRRRFSRSAIAGSAVLLSLGNRAAWGQQMGCMSVATLNSFNPSTGMFISAPAGGKPGQQPELAAQIHRVSGGSSDFIGESTEYVTISDPSSQDSVCLVKK